MSIPNDMTAKIIGDLISKGMSISGVNLEDRIKNEAIDALGEIRSVVRSEKDEKNKISSIKKIMENHNIW